jgi:hypothetical protein
VSDQSKSIDIYNKLGVSKDSSAQAVHKQFLKLINPLICKLKVFKKSDKIMAELRTLWIAHDILVDPDCRTDYDLRSMGIITNDSNEEIEDNLIGYGGRSESKSKPASWRIGELLQATGLLEQAELDIACDMHRAMPEMQFGRFLVKQDFLNENQLQAILLGQSLIRSGDLTRAQFVSVMEKVSKTKGEFKELLLESGYIKNPRSIKLDNDTSASDF